MLVDRPRDIYDKGFFDSHFAGALESARVVAPLVCDLIQPATCLGCRLRSWRMAAGLPGDRRELHSRPRWRLR